MVKKNVPAQDYAPASASEELTARLRLSVACVLDIASLAGELQAMGRRLHANDGNNTALAAEVLAARVGALANVICSALDDEGDDLAELENIIYAGGDAQRPTLPAATTLVAAVLAEGAKGRGSKPRSAPQ